MNKDAFWEIIETAKNKSGKDIFVMHQNILDALMELSPDDIFRWGDYFGTYLSFSETLPMNMAASVLKSGGDDGFLYFRAWLISQGKKVYMDALKNPDSLANLGITVDDEFWSEDMLGVAYEAYADKLNDLGLKEGDEVYISDKEIGELKKELVFADSHGLNNEAAFLGQINKRIPLLSKIFGYKNKNIERDVPEKGIEEYVAVVPKEEGLKKGQINVHRDGDNISVNYHPNDDIALPFFKDASKITEYFSVAEGPLLEDISELENYTQISGLSFCAYEQNFDNLKDFSPLYKLTQLEHLRLGNFSHLKNIDFVRNMPNLRKLCLSRMINLEDISAIETLENLDQLIIWGSPKLNKIPSLEKSRKSITCLRIMDNKNIASIEGLKYLENVEELWLSNCNISDIRPLENINAQKMNLSRNRIEDISPLEHITDIDMLDLSRNKISDLSPLSNILSIETLDLSGNKIEDISPLKNIRQATSIDLKKNKKLTDIKPLSNVNLSSLELKGTSVTDWSGINVYAYLDIRDN